MVRIKVGPKVDRDLYEEFKQLVKNRYGQTRGVLGIELDNALKNHIDQLRTRVTTTDNQPVTDQASMIEEEPSTHTHQPTDKFEELILSFKKEFKTSLEISKKQLEEFCIKTLGISDPRAIASKINVLEVRNLIRPIGSGGVYENLLASGLSKDTSMIKEDNYRIVRDYFDDNNMERIYQKDIPELPKNIRDLLTGLDYDKFIEFVE